MSPEPRQNAGYLRVVSSMATAALLRELTGEHQRRTGQTVELISIGGVQAVRRVQEREPFDLVVLAADAIQRLLEADRLLGGSRADLVRAGVAMLPRTLRVAIGAGLKRPPCYVAGSTQFR